MKTYQLSEGDTLVFSVNDAPWETIAFESKDFADITAARAEELAAVVNRTGSLAAYADEQGRLVLATVAAGAHTSLDVDVEHSTAARPLGLDGAEASAHGDGLRAARLVSPNAEPFKLPVGGELLLTVDGHRRRVVFDAGIKPGVATAEEVARTINAKKKKVAEVTRDGRVALTSNTVGAGSMLQIDPAPEGKSDAASALGFIGATGYDEPHQLVPARIACDGRSSAVLIVNVTNGPIELHFPTGTTVLPASGGVPLAPSDAASEQLQRLIAQGVVLLAPASEV